MRAPATGAAVDTAHRQRAKGVPGQGGACVLVVPELLVEDVDDVEVELVVLELDPVLWDVLVNVELVDAVLVLVLVLVDVVLDDVVPVLVVDAVEELVVDVSLVLVLVVVLVLVDVAVDGVVVVDDEVEVAVLVVVAVEDVLELLLLVEDEVGVDVDVVDVLGSPGASKQNSWLVSKTLPHLPAPKSTVPTVCRNTCQRGRGWQRGTARCATKRWRSGDGRGGSVQTSRRSRCARGRRAGCRRCARA